jgi:hypothetical protein
LVRRQECIILLIALTRTCIYVLIILIDFIYSNAQVKPLQTGFKVPQGCRDLHAPWNGLGRLVSRSATPSKPSEAVSRSQADSDRCK